MRPGKLLNDNLAIASATLVVSVISSAGFGLGGGPLFGFEEGGGPDLLREL